MGRAIFQCCIFPCGERESNNLETKVVFHCQELMLIKCRPLPQECSKRVCQCCYNQLLAPLASAPGNTPISNPAKHKLGIWITQEVVWVASSFQCSGQKLASQERILGKSNWTSNWRGGNMVQVGTVWLWRHQNLAQARATTASRSWLSGQDTQVTGQRAATAEEEQQPHQLQSTT